MNNTWTFDDSVAVRFQHEAESHIPSYHTVIEKCINFAIKNLQKTDLIIDVGSALGFTIKKFKDAGFTNIVGVENSPAMIARSLFPDLVIESSSLPANRYKLILANWTLHFVNDKVAYLQNVYNCLDNGYFILTDKTEQSDLVKNMYYDFKRSKGVSDQYIFEKEKQLQGIMVSKQISWYIKTLENIGFQFEIIHADLGFVTFLCSKS